jgi:hypothetical protein
MKALFTFFALFIATTLTAQRNCGSHQHHTQMLAQSPAIAQAITDAETKIQRTLSFIRRDTNANELIRIPVVVHVLYNTEVQNISEAQIRSQIESLNKDFSNQNTDNRNRPAAFKHLAADVRIQFCLAQVNPQGQRTTGIVRKSTPVQQFTANDAMKFNLQGGSNAWDSKKYLNIWVCAMGSRSLGYATLPGSPADKDGVVIAYDVFGTQGVLRAPFNKGRTATHEVGHWMGLQHIWGDTQCGSDGIDDTPRQKSYNFGCPSFPQITDCSTDGNGDMFMNYMDFSDDACMNMFTHGQKRKMRAAFANGNARNGFLASFACDSSLAQSAPLPQQTQVQATAPDAIPQDTYNVYPNPVADVATITYNTTSERVAKAYALFNATGVVVLKGMLTTEKNSVNMAALPAGIYVLKVGNFATKILKK